MIVQDGQGNEIDEVTGLQVIDTGDTFDSRFARMMIGTFRMLRIVWCLKPKMVHFHDPELIPVGIVLKLSGITVIYDVHEDVPKQTLGKFYLPLVVRKPLSIAVGLVERVAGKCFDAMVPVTPEIAKRFPSAKTAVVHNFPLKEELLVPKPVSYNQRPAHFAYVGNITRARGAKEIVGAIGRIADEKARLIFAGDFSPKNVQEEIEKLPGWDRVDCLGWIDRKQVANLLGNTRAGLVVIHPTPNHISSQPIKMFEYMAAGLPVIASDFPLWRKILAGEDCGILVDPLKPSDIAKAMQWILDNPKEAEAMGRRGRQAVEDKYNWEQEAVKLISLYDSLLENI